MSILGYVVRSKKGQYLADMGDFGVLNWTDEISEAAVMNRKDSEMVQDLLGYMCFTGYWRTVPDIMLVMEGEKCHHFTLYKAGKKVKAMPVIQGMVPVLVKF